MSLLEQIQQAQLEARKSHDTHTLETMQVVLSAIKNERIEKQRDLTDDDVVAVLHRQVKQLKDALTDFEKFGRDDLIQKTRTEISLIELYLPRQMSQDEVEHVAQQIVNEFGESTPIEFGKLMGLVMTKVRGRADGSLVREVVQKILEK